MRKYINISLLITIIILCFNNTLKVFGAELTEKSPWHVSLQWIGFTIHPNGGIIPEIYPLKLDKKANAIVELGTALSLDYDITKKHFIRQEIALYKDCAFVTAGFFHIGFRGIILEWGQGRHSINGGFGPTLIFRRDWHRFPEYGYEGFYGNRIYNGWQYRFIIYGGEFEYLYKLNDKCQFQYSIIPGVPFVLTSKFGVRYSF